MASTIVIVHGSGTGGWLWRPVRSELVRMGFDVLTPTMTGFGERVHLMAPEIDLSLHTRDICGVIKAEELPSVVLVGHSYGGMVATMVADHMPERIERLVYVDAFVPKDGESFMDLVPPFIRDTERVVLENREKAAKIPRAFVYCSDKSGPDPLARSVRKQSKTRAGRIAISPPVTSRC